MKIENDNEKRRIGRDGGGDGENQRAKSKIENSEISKKPEGAKKTMAASS